MFLIGFKYFKLQDLFNLLRIEGFDLSDFGFDIMEFYDYNYLYIKYLYIF